MLQQYHKHLVECDELLKIKLPNRIQSITNELNLKHQQW